METKVKPKSLVIAALLSAIIPGAGQIYAGNVSRGLAVFAIFGCSLWTLLILIGFVLVPIVWLVGVYDAVMQANLKNTATILET